MPVIFPVSSSSLRNNACWYILDIVASLHSFVSRNSEIAKHCVPCVLHSVGSYGKLLQKCARVYVLKCNVVISWFQGLSGAAASPAGISRTASAAGSAQEFHHQVKYSING